MNYKELEKIDSLAKRPVDFFTELLCYPLSIRLVYFIRNTSISPNMLTLASIGIGITSAFFFLFPTSLNFIIGGVLFWISYVFDCADGQLARYKKIFSPYGGFIDQVGDRIKEFSLVLSLSISGYKLFGSVNIFPLGTFTLFLIYLLEYYGQQNAPIPVPPDFKERGRKFEANPFEKKISKYLKFYGFNIGEQVGVISLSTIFLQNPFLTFYLVIFFALPMVFYKPLRRYLAYRSFLRKTSEASRS